MSWTSTATRPDGSSRGRPRTVPDTATGPPMSGSSTKAPPLLAVSRFSSRSATGPRNRFPDATTCPAPDTYRPAKNGCRPPSVNCARSWEWKPRRLTCISLGSGRFPRPASSTGASSSTARSAPCTSCGATGMRVPSRSIPRKWHPSAGWIWGFWKNGCANAPSRIAYRRPKSRGAGNIYNFKQIPGDLLVGRVVHDGPDYDFAFRVNQALMETTIGCGDRPGSFARAAGLMN